MRKIDATEIFYSGLFYPFSTRFRYWEIGQ